MITIKKTFFAVVIGEGRYRSEILSCFMFKNKMKINNKKKFYLCLNYIYRYILQVIHESNTGRYMNGMNELTKKNCIYKEKEKRTEKSINV